MVLVVNVTAIAAMGYGPSRITLSMVRNRRIDNNVLPRDMKYWCEGSQFDTVVENKAL